MSYGRNPHYIWSDGEHMRFGSVSVRENILNAFLYKILLDNRREDLGERLRLGKAEWLKQVHVEGTVHDGNWQIVETPADDPERLESIAWMESKEDEVIKALMAVPPEE